MANSKSNIYPIQLQGAELNLNKLDAEIKQYSGFNKNNSPFVGGCLSNVFHKEEQVTSGNADNIYIDTNGDVYRVNTEGLYQNDNKIIIFSDTVKFYEKHKINIKENCKKAISENIYITVENDVEMPINLKEFEDSAYISSVYVAHWGNNFSHILCSVKSNIEPFIDIAYKDGKICFSCKRVKTGINPTYNAPETRCINDMLFVPDENAENYYKYDAYTLNDNSFIPASTHGTINTAGRWFEIYKDENVSQAVCFKTNNLWWAFNTGSNSAIIVIDYSTGNYIVKKTMEDSNNNLMSTNFADWYMTQNGLAYLYRLSSNSFTLTSNKRDFYQALRLNYDDTQETFTYTLIRSCRSQVNNDTVIGGLNYTKPVQGILRPWGCHYQAAILNNSNTNEGLFINACNDWTNMSGSYNQDKDINECQTGGSIILPGFKILINNNSVSNISVVDTYTDQYVPHLVRAKNTYSGSIVEDWNIIKDVTVFDDKIIYSDFNNNYYVIKIVNHPKIKNNNGQLVVNCNQEANAFSLEQKRIMHFAPDWNCSYIKQSTNNIGSLNLNYFNMYVELKVNRSFIAAAINEYDLKNNASIILNPVNIMATASTMESDFLGVGNNFTEYGKYTSAYIKNYMDLSAVNVYTSISELPVIYKGTASEERKVNDDLEGLPFPTNTDGNVQYNPNLFSDFIYNFGTDVFVKNNNNVYQLMKQGQENIMSYFLGTLVEGLEKVFIIQGQYYGIINNMMFALQFQNGVIADSTFIVNIQGLQYCGNTPYEALFFSKTNRCLYSFTGVNVLNQKQLVDKISEVRNYLYNPATQTVFLITDIGVLFYGLFGMFLLEYTDITNIFLLDNGIVMSDNSGNYRYIKYYLDEGDEGYTKENIRLETCFYGMNNEVVTINDCLYFRLFSEEHEEGDLKVSATTISLKGRQTEETTFKIKASDWDAITHTIYLRYQPKTQRGLGVSFSIDSPFKIASMSVGSQPDAVLVDKVSKGAITAPSVTTNNNEW